MVRCLGPENQKLCLANLAKRDKLIPQGRTECLLFQNCLKDFSLISIAPFVAAGGDGRRACGRPDTTNIEGRTPLYDLGLDFL